MKLKTKKMVFVGLCILTAGTTVGGIFLAPIFALAGTSLIGTIAVGKIMASHTEDEEHDNAPVHPELTPEPQSNKVPIGPTHDLTLDIEEKKEDIILPEAPELERQFSMHIMYTSHKTSPGGTVSPDSVDVTVHTHGDKGHSRGPSPLR